MTVLPVGTGAAVYGELFMRITVSMLFSCLPEDAGIYCPYPKNEISGIRSINEMGSRYDTAYLYIGGPEAAENFGGKISLDDYENLSILICSGQEVPDSVMRQKKNNIIIISSEEDYNRTVSSISSILDHGFIKSVMSEELLEMLKDGCELQEIMDYGYRRLGNPVMLMDASFNYLASSGVSEDIDEPVWEYAVKNGIMPEFFLGCIEYDGSSHGSGVLSQEENDILRMKDEYNELINHRMTFIRITQHRHVIGYLSLMESRALITEYDISILRLIGGFLAIELAKSIGHTNYNFTLIDNFLISILKNSISSPEEIELRQKLLELRLKDQMYVINVEIPGQYTTEAQIDLLSRLKMRLNRNNAVLLNRQIIIVYDTIRTEQEFQNQVLKELEHFLKSAGCRANVSYPFSRLRDLYEFYQQTLHCVKIREALGFDDTLIRYEDVIDYHMILSFSGSADLRFLIHGAVKTLMEMDRANDSSYVATLFTYLRCGRNLTEAAKQMSLHYNTLKYRINRIVSLTGLNFEDDREIFKLMVTERVMKILDRTDIVGHTGAG